MSKRGVRVCPIAGALGAEIEGVDLGLPPEEDTIGQLRAALLRHLVVFFREQTLSPRQHLELARAFGRPSVHPYVRGVEGHDEIMAVVKEPGETRAFGDAWHTDLSYTPCPSMGSILYAKEVPDVGGDTLFANMQLAYEGLSPGMKAMLAPLRAVHRALASQYQEYAGMKGNEGEPSVVDHPVVRTHPETGAKSLYVNPVFTKHFCDMSEAESRPLLELLFAHCVRPEFTCRFRWSEGCVAFWDNRCTMHYAIPDYHPTRPGYRGQRRCMHRVTIEGERPS